MHEIRRTKAIWTIALISFLVLALGISYFLYTNFRGFSYFKHPPSYYDKLSNIKLIIMSAFQFVSSIACAILAISVWLEKIDIEYEKLFYVTCFALCITTIILEYFKFWERMYNEVIAGCIIVGAMTLAMFSLSVNVLINFVKDKIANNYVQLEKI